MANTIRFYHYEKCDGCRKARKFLDARKVDYDAISIVEKPPSRKELETMLGRLGGELKRLFNTSGKVYRERGLSKILPSMKTGEALALLAKNGMLIKRPFLLTEGAGLVGFRPEEWKRVFS
ncbi:MAG: ArsC family transcriptional regulator [Elusimicrobia bacterium]|nr:MAG: ArsC family transcriptional regulator [Elusimicrobiota bacterium]